MENNNLPKTQEEAKKWIEEGGRCIHKTGVWSNANRIELSKERALKMLPNFDFNNHYDRLFFERQNETEYALIFQEPSHADLF